MFDGYRKIPKISPGAYIFQKPLLRGLYSEELIYGGKFAFQTRLIVGGKFPVFASFYFLFECNFPSTSARGGFYLERRFKGGYFALPDWGAYIRRGLISILR